MFWCSCYSSCSNVPGFLTFRVFWFFRLSDCPALMRKFRCFRSFGCFGYSIYSSYILGISPCCIKSLHWCQYLQLIVNIPCSWWESPLYYSIRTLSKLHVYLTKLHDHSETNDSIETPSNRWFVICLCPLYCWLKPTWIWRGSVEL